MSVATTTARDKQSEPPKYSDAPEVVPDSLYGGDGGKVVIQDNSSPEVLYVDPRTTYSRPVTTEPSTFTDLDKGWHSQEEPARRPWQRRKTWAVAALVLIVLVGLVVGLAAGLTVKHHKTEAEVSNSTTTTKHDSHNKTGCDKDGFCRSVLQYADFNNSIYLFARTKDNQIVFKTNQDRSWGSWDENWTNLGAANETMISPPSPQAWTDNEGNPKLEVFAVSKEGNSACHRSLSKGSWSAWKELNPSVGSQLATCTFQERVDIWGKDAGSNDVSHNWYIGSSTTPNWYSVTQGNGLWQQENIGSPTTGIAVLCRNDSSVTSIKHDVAWYEDETDRRVTKHYQWDQNRGWLDSKSYAGDFIGDPTMLRLNATGRFLGVQKDHKVYHYSWVVDKFSSLSSIGGSIVSTPNLMSVDYGKTWEVFALGTNGNIQWQHFNGKSWNKEWRDIGIKARSAPVTTYRSSKEIWGFVIDENDEAKIFMLSVPNGKIDWTQSIRTMKLGGSLSNKGYYLDP